MSEMAILSESELQMMVGTEDTTAGAIDHTIEKMVREHSRFVFRLAYSILRNHSDAEDATQEVFIRVLKNKHKLSDVREHKLWLAKIAWRVSLDWKKSLDKRRPATESALLLDQLPAISSHADDAIASAQMRALLEKLIATLPADLRETLALSTVQELNSAEIATILGIPEGSVRTRLMRARTILKQKMSAALGEANG
jgi:RNA polymerase sigma-70 factor (ECF subfamily)